MTYKYLCTQHKGTLYKADSNRHKREIGRDIQDGKGVRRGDQHPPDKHIKNTCTCGTTPTEHLMNDGRRLQISQKARKSPCNYVGQNKKEKTETKE